jgi:hypothetical protein
MPAPTDAGRVTSSTGANLGTHTINLPSTAAGQLLVLLVRSGLASTIDVPGFTLLAELGPDATGDEMQVLTRIADGTEAATVEATTSALCKFAAICWAITNGEAPTLGSVVTGSGTGANPGSSSPAGAPRDTLYLAMMGLDGELNTPTGGPAGYANFVAVTSGTAGGVATNVALAGASKAALASSSDDAGAFTHPAANVGWTAVTVAVRYKAPAPATGATAGKPGTFTPPGGTIPANLAAMGSIVATPATPWYDGEYVVLGDASEASWNGSAWVAGRGTGGSPPVPTTPYLVQTVTRTPPTQPVTTCVLTLPQPVTAGNLILVGYTRDSSAAGTDAISDNRGTAYGAPVQLVDDASGIQKYWLWAGIAPVDGTYTITISLPSSSYVASLAAEYGNVQSKTPNVSGKVTHASPSGGGTDNIVGAPLTTTVDGCLIVGMFGYAFDVGALSPGTGYTEDVEANASGFPQLEFESLVQPAQGARAVTWTAPGATNYNAISAAFVPKPSAPAGAAVKRWTGSAWVAATVKRWTGSAWQTATPKRYDGSTWK